MTEASSTAFSAPTLSSPHQPTGLFARIGAAIGVVAEALADAVEMRREARRLYPNLSSED